MDDKWEIIKDLGPAAFLLQKMDAHICAWHAHTHISGIGAWCNCN